ncbi:hypothetical protein, partial [Serratia nevei]|uniref:hypothetical protein n=1 Tax=Serratia nevei TaxID=2703794 RepID=UPI00254F1C72
GATVCRRHAQHDSPPGRPIPVSTSHKDPSPKMQKQEASLYQDDKNCISSDLIRQFSLVVHNQI